MKPTHPISIQIASYVPKKNTKEERMAKALAKENAAKAVAARKAARLQLSVERDFAKQKKQNAKFFKKS